MNLTLSNAKKDFDSSKAKRSKFYRLKYLLDFGKRKNKALNEPLCFDNYAYGVGCVCPRQKNKLTLENSS